MSKNQLIVSPLELVIRTILTFLPGCVVTKGDKADQLDTENLTFQIFPNPQVLPYLFHKFKLPKSILLQTNQEIIDALEAPIRVAKEEFLSLEMGHIVERFDPDEERIEEARKTLTDAVPWIKV